MTTKIRPAILCGGSGTRLWPLSRSDYPKQLLKVSGENSLLQDTALRLTGSGSFMPPIVICNEAYRFLVQDQLTNVGITPAAILLEPEGRDTAPAATVVALRAFQDDPDAIVVLCPSDHVIANVEAFHVAIAHAATIAEKTGRLVTFGINPSRSETGFGYIERGNPLNDGLQGFEVSRFAEKPDAATADQYVASGKYQWNSGIFLFRASDFLEEIGRYEPEMLTACRTALGNAVNDLGFSRLDAAHFGTSSKISIDYAVMEKTSRAAVVPVDMGWNDLGSWTAFRDIIEPDKDGNVSRGDIVTVNAFNNILRSEGPLIVASGVSDLIVVSTKDAVLVASHDAAASMKEVIGVLDKAQRPEITVHPRVHRPWGWYETMDEGPGFKVKRIAVKPGQKLSLQKHTHRAEHWVVVTGTATVTRGDEILTLSANESTYISAGTAHRLENQTPDELHIVEVQTGSILTEEDIIRLDDDYGRK